MSMMEKSPLSVSVKRTDLSSQHRALDDAYTTLMKSGWPEASLSARGKATRRPLIEHVIRQELLYGSVICPVLPCQRHKYAFGGWTFCSPDIFTSASITTMPGIKVQQLSCGCWEATSVLDFNCPKGQTLLNTLKTEEV